MKWNKTTSTSTKGTGILLDIEMDESSGIEEVTDPKIKLKLKSKREMGKKIYFVSLLLLSLTNLTNNFI
jgi:hypothetical protein